MYKDRETETGNIKSKHTHVYMYTSIDRHTFNTDQGIDSVILTVGCPWQYQDGRESWKDDLVGTVRIGKESLMALNIAEWLQCP